MSNPYAFGPNALTPAFYVDGAALAAVAAFEGAASAGAALARSRGRAGLSAEKPGTEIPAARCGLTYAARCGQQDYAPRCGLVFSRCGG